MMGLPLTLRAGGMRLVVIIKYQHIVALINTREQIERVTIAASCQGIEKAEPLGQRKIVLSPKGQSQPHRQGGQLLAPFSRRNHAIDRQSDNDRPEQDEHENPNAVHGPDS